MPTDNTPLTCVFPVDHYTLDNIKTLKEILAATDTPVMIVYNTTDECHLLLKAIKGSSYYDGTETMLKKWNEGKIPVMPIHPRRATGAAFHKGGHTLIWFSAPASIAEYVQTNARLVRIGQTHDVTIHHIMDQDVIDPRWDVRLKPEDMASDSETRESNDA